jgi:hypothetical protein
MVRVEAAAGALFFSSHDALSGHDAGATLGSERTGAAYTKKNFLRKPFIICSLYRLIRYRLYTCTTRNGTHIIMCMPVCIFHIPDFFLYILLLGQIIRLRTYMLIPIWICTGTGLNPHPDTSLCMLLPYPYPNPYRIRNKSASGYGPGYVM